MTEEPVLPNAQRDPDSLADLLDILIPPGERGTLSPQTGDPMIAAAARLAAAPYPQLSAKARLRIREQIFTETDADMRARAASRAAPPWLLPLFAVGALIVLGGVLALASRSSAGGILAATSTSTSPAASATAPVMLASPTSLPTETLTHTPTAAPTETLTHTPTAAPTETLTHTPTAAPEATALPVVEQPIETARIVLEGPVQAVENGTAIVYDIAILLPPSEPLSAAVQVGDVVRITGTVTLPLADAAAITATVLDIVNVVVYINPVTGEIFRDDAPCSVRPPQWAAASGWQNRCRPAAAPPTADGSRRDSGEAPPPDTSSPPNPANPGGPGGSGGGNGGGDGGDDDDDDDDDD